MKKNYHPKNVESNAYQIWEKNRCFKTYINPNKKNFCIILPPPNITGGLHIGHAFQQSIIDILIRYHRMKGKNTLLQLGIDHAGIATQNILENQLKYQLHKTRLDCGKAEFLRKAWKWKKITEKLIIKQIKRLGCAADFDLLRFTMDDQASKSICNIFLRLYEKKLIYRKNRLIYWDTKLNTAISDLEVKHYEKNSKIWHLKYKLDNHLKTKEGLNFLEVATTRPETIFGDVAVAVNPKDIRYQNLIGKYVIVPLLNRAVPIIEDSCVKMELGTGCLKITPAHDFNDFNICKKHKLKMINIFTFSGNLRKLPEVFDYQGKIIKNEKINIPEEFHNIEKNKLRVLVIKKLKKLGYITKVQLKKIKFPIGDRSNVILEPMLTNQWYLKVKSLAKTAMKAVKDGKIKFIPKQYENLYFSWMNNVEDWCISRQIWWGHKIPIWYDNNQVPYAGNSESEIRKKFKIKTDIELVQDEDVLDTWFSSAVWSFVSLGWPEKSLFNIFHPTNIIVSGFDIIYFWIARMIMMTMCIVKDSSGKSHIPFNKVYITGLIRDQYGKKMSKSEGNVIDPIDIIDGISLYELLQKRTQNIYNINLKKEIENSTKKEFPNGIQECGADALRFSMAFIASNTRNINININQIIGCKNFCNKLWHASRFIFINTENKKINFDKDKIYFSPLDKWIFYKYNEILELHIKYLDNFRFDLSANNLYQFIWHQFCDWYLEISKMIFKEKIVLYLESTYYTLLIILKNLLKMLHPFIPFITEEIWQNFQKKFGKTTKNILILENFPEKIFVSLDDKDQCCLVEWFKKILIEIRILKIDMKIPLTQPINAYLLRCSQEEIDFITQYMDIFCKIFNLKSINFNLKNSKKNLNETPKLIQNVELYLG